jgi:tetratricopeptide (TPR) repeat protein
MHPHGVKSSTAKNITTIIITNRLAIKTHSEHKGDAPMGQSPFRCLLITFVLSGICLASEVSDLHKQGIAFYDQKKYPEAIAAFEQAVESEEPHSAEYSQSALYLGESYFSLRQPAKAIAWLEKATPSVDVNYLLGNAFLQTRKVDKAEIAFARLYGVAADSAAGHLLAAELMLKRKYEQDALSQVNKALAMDPQLPAAHFMLGDIAVLHGMLDQGIAEMSKEIEINPNFYMVWYRMGEILARQERWAAAIPNLERAIWLNADFSGSYIVLGKCYFKVANYSNAEGVLRHALTIDPNHYTATYLLGQTLMAEGKKDEGQALLDEAKVLEHR